MCVSRTLSQRVWLGQLKLVWCHRTGTPTRIVSVLALPTANSQARMGSVLLRVQLYWPASLLDVQSAAATVNVELWHHNYTIINHTDCTTHLLPADLIGPLVVVMPDPQRLVAKLGYCLVLQV